jgi:hypothetical protein
MSQRTKADTKDLKAIGYVLEHKNRLQNNIFAGVSKDALKDALEVIKDHNL